MQTSDFVHTKQTIAYPNCPACGEQMFLARIEPDRPDHDKRKFECPRCHHEVIEIVKYK
jgi:predicted RNA-binding Zn-ribbon protein involved in translation (DUF1610 family)